MGKLVNDLTPAEFEKSWLVKGLSPLIVPAEIGSSGENVNNGIGRVLVMPMLGWNGENSEERERNQNRTSGQES